ncbi:unnamed protein product [Cochlearia groenlandica]
MTLTSSSSSTPKTSFDFRKNNNSQNLHVPLSSSSSYLTCKEETTKNLKTLNMSFLSNKEDLVDKTKRVKKASQDPEIGVFGAEKYFNGDMDSDQSSSVLSLTNPEVERFIVDSKYSPKQSIGTQSVLSESSLNSQSILLHTTSLQDKKANSGQIQKVSTSKKSFLKKLRCRCACSDGKSVDIDSKISVKRSSDPDINVSATRKIENQMDSSVSISKDLIKIQNQEEVILQRKSLEVFRSPVNTDKNRIVVHKKLTKTEEEDTKSDTSSDLFEIDSLTSKPKPFLARQGSDPSASPTCYAPSEVSVEWSIVTASAAGFSVMSECATSPIRKNPSSRIHRNPNNNDKSPHIRRKTSSSIGTGLLMSCKSNKSIRVSGDSAERRSSLNYKTQPKSYVHRFPMESNKPKPKSFETRRRISNSSVSHTHSSLIV